MDGSTAVAPPPSLQPTGDVPSNIADLGDESHAKKQRLSVERIYQKKTQLEHILLRPDSYIGSTHKTTQGMWVMDEEKQCMVYRDITYSPGLYKIFDEILVNAADNKVRDPTMSCIKVDVNPTENMVRIWNNGKGIPVVLHKVENVFVPTLIFGHLLTSSNYDDSERKVTGGRNGYGAKLCNIFSTKFIVETSSKDYKKSFRQVWIDNMTKTSDPKISPEKGEDYTSITFYPDLKRFEMSELEADTVALFIRRAYDLAATTIGVKVFLNGKRLPIKSFTDYVDFYLKSNGDEAAPKIVYESVNPRWQVAVAPSSDGFQQVSFVNSIATTKGGKHVDLVADQICNKLIEIVKKKSGKSGVSIKPFQIKSHMWLFVNCLIENPAFDSQTKECMTLTAKNFGSTCPLSEKFISQASKCGIVESVLSWVNYKAKEKMDKQCSKSKHVKLKGIPKLDDANNAGTKNSALCTLILTEGDSAKSLAVAGLGVLGRDNYGVFPLRGKLLNVREASSKQILENNEINSLIKIIGLQYKLKYDTPESLKDLRYGKIMIMTDQDQDGSHIKGLIINFIHCNWPNLLRHNIVEEFITPIVKVFKNKQELAFYSLPEFEEWQKATPNWHTWRVKYYKGLGTSTGKEAKEYFSEMARHRVRFRYTGPEDDASIHLAFDKSKLPDRKNWLTDWTVERKRRRELGLPEPYLYGKETHAVSYHDFIHKELVLFSNLDNERSIPSMVDGLKPGQRKVLFVCLKRNLIREIKVAQLAGSVSEMSAYHHGEQSLLGTIVGLAQDFVGSNNLNLLLPIGQFGTRLSGGKDAASARYIFTALNPLTRLVFHPADDPILNYLHDDNQRIEPEWYAPIVPMVLINGAEGIGTGYATRIPNYSVLEVIHNLYRLLDGETPLPMLPSFRGFRGTIQNLVMGRACLPYGWRYATGDSVGQKPDMANAVSCMQTIIKILEDCNRLFRCLQRECSFTELEANRYVVHGEVAVLSQDTLEITELPIRTWTQAYKETVLEVMLNGTDKVQPSILDYKEYHTDVTVRFVIKMTPEKLREAEAIGLHKFFKLSTTLTTNSMVVFDHLGSLKLYHDVQTLLRDFYELRLKWYVKRKSYLEGMLSAEARKLENQARFVVEKIDGRISIENKPKKELIRILQAAHYDSDPVRAWRQCIDKLASIEEELESGVVAAESSQAESAEPDGPDYNYILGMPLWSLTKERKDDLLAQRDAKQAELHELRAKTPSMLWREDLGKLEEAYKKFEEESAAQEHKVIGSSDKKGDSKGAGSGRAAAQKSLKRAQETKPDPNGIRIPPVVDPELLKKLEVDRKRREKKANTANAGDGNVLDNSFDDDFDLNDDSESSGVPKPLMQRLASGGTNAQALVSSDTAMGRGRGRGRGRGGATVPKRSSETTSAGPSPGKKKGGKKKSTRKPWESDSDDGVLEISDDEMEDKFDVRVDVDVPATQRSLRPVAKVTYNVDEGEDEEDDSSVESENKFHAVDHGQAGRDAEIPLAPPPPPPAPAVDSNPPAPKPANVRGTSIRGRGRGGFGMSGSRQGGASKPASSTITSKKPKKQKLGSDEEDDDYSPSGRVPGNALDDSFDEDANLNGGSESNKSAKPLIQRLAPDVTKTRALVPPDVPMGRGRGHGRGRGGSTVRKRSDETSGAGPSPGKKKGGKKKSTRKPWESDSDDGVLEISDDEMEDKFDVRVDVDISAPQRSLRPAPKVNYNVDDEDEDGSSVESEDKLHTVNHDQDSRDTEVPLPPPAPKISDIRGTSIRGRGKGTLGSSTSASSTVTSKKPKKQKLGSDEEDDDYSPSGRVPDDRKRRKIFSDSDSDF